MFSETMSPNLRFHVGGGGGRADLARHAYIKDEVTRLAN